MTRPPTEAELRELEVTVVRPITARGYGEWEYMAWVDAGCPFVLLGPGMRPPSPTPGG